MPQYVLTCPQCRQQTPVRFIRKGATATCRACQHQYRVDAASLTLDGHADGAEAPAEKDRPFELLRDRLSPSSGATAAAEPAVESPVAELAQSIAAPPAAGPAPAAPAKPDVAAVAAAAAASAPRDPTVARARLADRRTRNRKKSAGPLIAAAVLTGLILVGVLIGLMASGGSSGKGPNPPNAINPPDQPDGPDTPEAPVTPPTPSIPVLTLQVPPVVETVWKRIDPPATPLPPRDMSGGAVWQAGFVRDSATNTLRVLGLFVEDSDTVYRTANVRVQLLDERKMAYAEMFGTVPVVCAAQGVQMALPVPPELADKAGGLVTRFEPVDPLPGAVPLEMVETRAKLLNPTPDGWRVELAVRNPHASAVSDPTIVVDLLDATGAMIQTWRGSLRGSIEPGAEFPFQTVLPVPADAEPGRVSVRGYAVRGR